MKKPFRYTVTFDYRPDLVSGYEVLPQLCFRHSADVGHQLVKVDPLIDNTVTMHIDDIDAAEEDTTLTVSVFVTSHNDRGEPCSNEAGSAYVFLGSVLNTAQPTSVTLPVVVANAGVQKGEITLNFERVVFPNNNKSPFVEKSRFTINKSNQSEVVRIMTNEISENNLIFENNRSTFSAVDQLHLPVWRYDGWAIPGDAFGMVRAKPSPEAVWTNMTNCALRRKYPKMSLAAARLHFVTLATEQEILTTISMMHSMYINYVPYLSDGVPVAGRSSRIHLPFSREEKVSHKSMEAFSCNIRVRGSPCVEKSDGSFTYVAPGADCEDGGAEQGFESMELKTGKFTDEVLLTMQKVRQNYFYLQVLMGVNGAQLSDGQDIKSAYKNLGGHMCGAYISRETFFKFHKKHNTVDCPYEGLKMGDRGVRAPIQFLEGTGLIDPEASAEYANTMCAYQYLSEGYDGMFNNVKFIAPQNNNKLNAFYRVVQSAVCIDLYDEGYSNAEHVYLTTSPETGLSTTGCSHIDFISEKSTVSSYAMPPKSEEQIRVKKQILKQAFPVEAFEVPERLNAERAHNKILEPLRLACEGRKQGRDYNVAMFFVRFDQVGLVGEKWRKMVESKEKVFKVRYYNEEITKGYGGFAVFFYVNK